MNRASSLSRRTPLLRSAPLRRTTPLRPRSARTARRYVAERVPLVRALLESRPWCEIACGPVCTGRATAVHEPLLRSRGGDPYDVAACVTTCASCHRAAHDHPVQATRRGWLVPSWSRP